MSDDDDDQSPQNGRQRQRSRSRDRVHPYALAPQAPPVPPIQPMVIQEPATEPDEDPGSSGRQPRSRSSERAPVNVPPSADEESAPVEPQGRVSDRSRSPQRTESPQRQKGKKTTAEVKKPSDLSKAKKHKPMDSDEDDEVPQNEPGTSSHSASSTCATSPIKCQKRRYNGWTNPINYQFKVHRPIQPRPVHKEHRPYQSQDESTDKNDEHGKGESGPAIQSARSHDSGNTVLYPDLYVLTNDERWTMTPEAHKPQPGHFVS